MRIEYLLWGINCLLLLALAGRLQLRQTGIFTVGFFNLGTLLLPHFLFPPLVMLLTEDPRIDSEYFVPALLVVTVMFFGLLLGTLVSTRKDLPFVAGREAAEAPLLAVVILLGITIAAILGLLYMFIGTADPYKLMQMARTQTFRGPYLDYNLSYPVFLVRGMISFLHVLLVWKLYAQSASFASFLKGLLATLLVSFAMLSFGSRAAFFTPLMLFMFVTHYLYRRIPTSFLVILFVVCIPIFVLIRFTANGLLGDMVERGLATNADFIGGEFLRRMEGFGNILNFLDWFATQSFALGQTFLDLLLRPVPRLLFTEKPYVFDVFLTHNIYGKDDFGGGIRIFGGVVEMYYNFWLIGVLVWAIPMGILLYRCHFGTLQLLQSRAMVPAAMVLANPALLRGLANLGVDTIAMRNLLTNLVVQLLVLLCLFVVARILSRYKDRQALIPQTIALQPSSQTIALRSPLALPPPSEVERAL